MTPIDAPAGEKAADTEARPAGRAAGKWITGAVIVVLLVTTAFFGFRWWQAEQSLTLREEAVAAAREHAVALGTYDFRSFDDNLEAVRSGATEEFAAEYDKVAADLRGLVESGEGTSTARIEHAGLESIDGDVATVLVFLDQDVKNVMAPEGRTDATRFLITLKRVGDRWLLDAADAR